MKGIYIIVESNIAVLEQPSTSVYFEKEIAETFSESCSFLGVSKKFYEKTAETSEGSDGDADLISHVKQRVREMGEAIDDLEYKLASALIAILAVG